MLLLKALQANTLCSKKALCVPEQQGRKVKSAGKSNKSSNHTGNKEESEGYTHCLIRGPMSFPETLEMDLRKP